MMTLNMPGFTSCAKLYGNLMTIMKKVEYKIEEEKKAAAGLMVQEKKSKSKKLELSYSDQLT